MRRWRSREKQVEGIAKEEKPVALRRTAMREVMEDLTRELKFNARIDELEFENARLTDNSKEAIER